MFCRETFSEVPSYKFVPLVYQIASRMSASTTNPLYLSGFQPALHGLIERMATDHPYHVLCQLLALKNGNLGSDGKIESGPVSIVMSRDVDLDKVEVVMCLQLIKHDLVCFDEFFTAKSEVL